MITISTDNTFDASILMAVQAMISSGHIYCDRGDKLHALVRMMSYLAPPGSFKTQFSLEDGEFSPDDISRMKALRRQCQLIDRSIEELIANSDSP